MFTTDATVRAVVAIAATPPQCFTLRQVAVGEYLTDLRYKWAGITISVPVYRGSQPPYPDVARHQAEIIHHASAFAVHRASDAGLERNRPNEVVDAILKEANSLLSRVASATMSDVYEPEYQLLSVRGPMESPPTEPIPIHTHDVAVLMSMLEVMRKPPALYPTIYGLRPGSYMCTVEVELDDTRLNVPLTRG